ncbi:MAG TPA: penicillin-binding protein 2 [Longimicrobiales bacterium]|nr:penicillin-binding protein 2 [Longimicrobiales bacterium]
MDVFHLHARRRRAQSALGVVCLILAFLTSAFFQTQVVRNPAYAMQSDQNRLRPLTLPAPRGEILDRNGRIIAENVPGYTLSLLSAPEDSVRSTLQRLAPLLDLTEEEVTAILERRRRNPQHQLVVSKDIPFDRVAAIEERRPLFPEVLIEMQPKRRYPSGRAAAHVIGYVGEISDRQLADSVFAGYDPGTVVGKAGVERAYERTLSGVAGVRYVEVDALGRIVGSHRPVPEVAPVPGEPVRLNIDLDLQEWIAGLLADTVRGAVAVLEPQTSRILALYSSPSYDPNDFAGNVSPAVWQALQEDPERPLLNRAISGVYPPGSTWKLATGAIALELGVVQPGTTLPLPCRGGMQYGNRYFRCWDPQGHGYLDLPGALKHSCDVYFYQVGLQIGLERLLMEGTRMGFRQTTGVDLPGERRGNFPTGLDWFRTRFGNAPTEAEVLSMSIGQGPNDQSALKMAQFYVALAGDGVAPAPRLLADARMDGPAAPGTAAEAETDSETAVEYTGAMPAAGVGGEVWDLDVSGRTLGALREGLRGVTAPEGTAYGSSLEHWEWMGKTGTSQNSHGPDHGWFVGIGGSPGGAPEVVVSVIIEAGEHGSDVAQTAAKIADYYLRKQHGMPIDTIQTLREHWLTGTPARWAWR